MNSIIKAANLSIPSLSHRFPIPWLALFFFKAFIYTWGFSRYLFACDWLSPHQTVSPRGARNLFRSLLYLQYLKTVPGTQETLNKYLLNESIIFVNEAKYSDVFLWLPAEHSLQNFTLTLHIRGRNKNHALYFPHFIQNS